MEDCFTVDICLPEKWLEHAYKTSKKDGIVRVTIVIKDSGSKTTYKVGALGGGDNEYLTACMSGDFMSEPAWRGQI